MADYMQLFEEGVRSSGPLIENPTAWTIGGAVAIAVTAIYLNKDWIKAYLTDYILDRSPSLPDEIVGDGRSMLEESCDDASNS